jgi:hypothetical protein
MEEKKRFTRDSKYFNEKARMVVMYLRDYSKDNPCNSKALAEFVGISESNLHGIIKYMRRCSEEDLEKFISFYPISSKKGYFLPRNWDDFAPYFCTMYSWYNSVKRTIEPAKEKMQKEGIDYKSLLKSKKFEGFDSFEDYENYLMHLDDDPIIDKDTAWFLDN